MLPDSKTVTSTPEKPPVSKPKKSAAKPPADTTTITPKREVSPSASQASDTLIRVASADASSSTQKCKHCKKDIDRAGLAAHAKQCLKDKQERLKKKREAKEAKDAKDAKAKDKDDKETAVTVAPAATADADDETSIKPIKNAKKSTPASDLKKANTKKRKPTDDNPSAATGDATPGDKDSKDKPPPTKKQKKAGANDSSAAPATTTSTTTSSTAKAKAAKPKGPVDVERQCGVPLANGAMCARSLTCKSHAMGAKRAVPGRSLPYDILLAQYQKKNQAKQQKAAMASSAPLVEDMVENGAPVDSEEERDAVMAGVVRAAPRPLGWRALVGCRGRYQSVRLKELLAGAMAGSRGAGLFSTAAKGLGGAGAVSEADAVGELDTGSGKGLGGMPALKHVRTTSVSG